MTRGMIVRPVMAFAVVIAAASCVSPPAAPEAVPAAPEAVPAVPEAVPAVPEAVPAAPEAAAPPAAPGALTAQPGDRSISLAWDDPGAADIVSYEVRLRAPRDADWRAWRVAVDSTHATTSHELPNLTPGVLYQIQVRARNAAGAGPPSAASATPYPLLPAAPGGLTAQPGDLSISLSWDDPGDAGIASYEVRLRAPRDADWRAWKPVAGSTHATASHMLPGLTAGVLYQIQVRARSAAGAGPASETSAAPHAPAPPEPPDPPAPSETAAAPSPALPAAPGALTALAGDLSIGLDWNDPGDAGIASYEYRIRPAQDADWPAWRPIAGSTHATTGYTLLRGLANGVRYQIQVRARNAAGPGPPSETSATLRPPPPAAPRGLTALPGDRSVSLDWNDPGDAGIDSYEYRIRPAQDADWPAWRPIAGSTYATTGYTLLRGLANGVRYQIQVRARNAAGPGPPSETSATLRPPPPAAPRGLTALPGDRSVSLDWNDPGDAGIDSYEYRIRPAQDADWPAWRPIAGSTYATTGYTLLRGLANGVLYQIQLRARNAAGPGPASEISATPRPPAPRGAPPAAPTGLTARPGDLSISLGWDDPGDADIASYEFRLRAPRDADWRNWRAIGGSTRTTTAHTLPGLTNGVLYQVQLRARNAAGPGAPSQTSVTPNHPSTAPAK